MKYKVGDKVRIKSLDWYNTLKDDEGVVDCGQWWFDKKMSRFCGKIVTICELDDMFNWYRISEERNPHIRYNNNMIECLVERNGKTYPYKSEKIVKLNDVIQFLEEHYLDDKYWTSDGEDLFMHILLDDLKKKMEE